MTNEEPVPESLTSVVTPETEPDVIVPFPSRLVLQFVPRTVFLLHFARWSERIATHPSHL